MKLQIGDFRFAAFLLGRDTQRVLVSQAATDIGKKRPNRDRVPRPNCVGLSSGGIGHLLQQVLPGETRTAGSLAAPENGIDHQACTNGIMNRSLHVEVLGIKASFPGIHAIGNHHHRSARCLVFRGPVLRQVGKAEVGAPSAACHPRRKMKLVMQFSGV